MLKFRVWDKRPDGLGMLYNAQSHPFWFDFLDYPKIYEVMQFTGLLDNEGKEIYEGDILSCHAFDGWFDDGGHSFNFEVKHSIIKSGESDISGFVRVPESRVVIGNVFENPELLKKC